MNNLSFVQEPIVLAIYPGTRGFGYAVFQGMHNAVDWGIKTAKRETKHVTSMAHLRQLLDWFHPQVIVMQNCACTFLRCSKSVIETIESIIEVATRENIVSRLYTRAHIRECFSVQYGAINKHEIAHAIAKVIPYFVPRLPQKRKLWENESHYMPVFDAVSLVFAYYYFEFLQSEQRAA